MNATTVKPTARKQLPVPLNERPTRPHRLSMTWLSFFQNCKRSALLYTRNDGGPRSHEMDRGSVFHEVAARLTNEALESNEPTIPYEVAKAALNEVMANPKFTVPAEEWDWLRVCVYHFAEHTAFALDEIAGVEQLIVWDVGDWRISGKVDLCWLKDQTVGIRDYKTSRKIATQEEFEHNFQTGVMYPLLLAFGSPVTVSVCEDCDGFGTVVREQLCGECGGRGYIETVEQYPLGHGAQYFDVAEVYPGYVWDEGLAQRQRTFARTDLLDNKAMVEALLAQVSEVFESGQWDAVPGDHCGICPCRAECPLPEKHLPPDGSIASPDDAIHAAETWHFAKLAQADLQKALKAYVKENGPIPFGDDLQLNFIKQEVTETDRKGLSSAMEQGPVGDLSPFLKTRVQTRFDKEPRPVREQTLDEKYGAEAPF